MQQDIQNTGWPAAKRVRFVSLVGMDGSEREQGFVKQGVVPALRRVYPHLDHKPIRYGNEGANEEEAQRLLKTYCAPSAEYDLLILYVLVHGTTFARYGIEKAGTQADLYSTEVFSDPVKTAALAAASKLARQVVEKSENATKDVAYNGKFYRGFYDPTFHRNSPIRLVAGGSVRTIHSNPSALEAANIEYYTRKRLSDFAKHTAVYEYLKGILNRYFSSRGQPPKGAKHEKPLGQSSSDILDRQYASSMSTDLAIQGAAFSVGNRSNGRPFRYRGTVYTFSESHVPRIGEPIVLLADGEPVRIEPTSGDIANAKATLKKEQAIGTPAYFKQASLRYAEFAIQDFLLYTTNAGISGEEFARILDVTPKKPVIAIFSSCHSGSLLNDPIAKLNHVVALMVTSRSNEQSVVENLSNRSFTGLTERFASVLCDTVQNKSNSTVGEAFIAARQICLSQPDVSVGMLGREKNKPPPRPQALFRISGSRLAINGRLIRCE